MVPNVLLAQTTTGNDTKAEGAAPDADKPADSAITTVTVKGAKPQNRIDRQVYDNTKNIDSTTGTAADALNKVPSVNVDPNGNVSLRGNSNVQIYVDGKPSAMMSGDNRASALQAMSSADISSVEVMNNPGAQYSSEGAGGIINLVMKRNRRPGGSAVVNLNGGSDGRYNGGITGNYTNGALSWNGSVNIRHDRRLTRDGYSLEQLDADGAVLASTNESGSSETTMNMASLNGGVSYSAGERDTLAAQVNYANRNFENDGMAHYSTSVDAGRYDLTTASQSPHEDLSLDLNWDHRGLAEGEDLKTDLRLSRSTGFTDTDNLQTDFEPTPGSEADTRHQSTDLKTGVFSADYSRNVGAAQLSAGVQVTYDDNDFLNTATGDQAEQLASHFTYTQTLSAAYVTYQVPIGARWTVLGGLRAESLDLKSDDETAGTEGHTAYTKLNPSFFATYTVSETAKIRFSYSHRLQRPSAQDLNPHLTYVDAQHYTAGNPDLRPQETESLELGYEYAAGKLNYQARVFYKSDSHTLTQFSTFIDDPAGSGSQVILTTRQNYGTGNSGGLEFNIGGRIGKLNLNANTTLTHRELRTPGIAGTQTLDSPSGRIMADYEVTAKDRVQLMYFSSGKMLTGQGYTGPFAMGNLSYRRTLSPKLALVANVNDLFRTMKFRTVIDSDTIRSTQARSLGGQTFTIGLSYTLGGASEAMQQEAQWGGMRPPAGGGPRPGGPQ